jgi:hypothetical protein
VRVHGGSKVGPVDGEDRWGLALAAGLTDEEASMTAFSSIDALDPDQITMATKPATAGVMCTTPLICNC